MVNISRDHRTDTDLNVIVVAVVAFVKVINDSDIALSSRDHLNDVCQHTLYRRSINHDTHINVGTFGNRRSLDAERNTEDGKDKKAVQRGHV